MNLEIKLQLEGQNYIRPIVEITIRNQIISSSRKQLYMQSIFGHIVEEDNLINKFHGKDLEYLKWDTILKIDMEYTYNHFFHRRLLQTSSVIGSRFSISTMIDYGNLLIRSSFSDEDDDMEVPFLVINRNQTISSLPNKIDLELTNISWKIGNLP